MDKCSLLLHKLTEELHLLHCAACSCVRHNVYIYQIVDICIDNYSKTINVLAIILIPHCTS